jgi:hypothetical protein
VLWHCRSVRKHFEGIEPFAWTAAVLFVIGVIAVLLEIQSPSVVQWDGIKVHGITTGGVTYYTYRGQNYSVDNIHASSSDRTRRPTTVWLSRSNPTDFNSAYVENAWSRWLDFTIVMMWFFFSALVLSAGLLRRHFRRRRIVETMGMYGSGLSDEVVRRLLEKRRQPHPPPLIMYDDDY